MRVIVVFLPFLAMLFLWRGRLNGWRNAFFTAAIVWGGCLVMMTEFLSIGSHITPAWLMAGWIIVLVGIVAATRWIPLMQPIVPPSPPDGRLITWVLAPQILAIIAITAAVGWMGPPNNWDAMTYHMPRVFHWMQDRNVAFYPLCSNLRQLTIAPGSEYIFLHLQLLSGSDRLIDLVQWFAFCGCIIGVSSLAELLGAGRFGQQLASLAVATIPIACLEAESAQNDLIIAFWMLCFVRGVVRLCKMPPTATRNAIWFESAVCGIALGLALLTKATTYIYAVPFVLGLIVVLLWKLKLRSLAPLAMLAVIAISFSVPTYSRNYRFNHTLLGKGGTTPADPDIFANKPIGWRATVSNLMRNSALEMTFPPSRAAAILDSGICRILGWLKINPQDPNTTYMWTKFRLTDALWNSEDCAPNPIQFTLAVFAGLLLLVKCRRDKQSRLAALFGVAVFIAFLAFCTYLRWQPWHNRYHLPLIVMSSALIGVALERHINARLIALVFGLMSMCALAVVVENTSHPLVGYSAVYYWSREARFFTTRPKMQAPYEAVVAIAQKNHCRQIGLIIGGDDWEYPLDMMMRSRLPHVRIEAYPDSGVPIWTAQMLHTNNLGWDENLRPYIVVKVDGENASVVKVVP